MTTARPGNSGNPGNSGVFRDWERRLASEGLGSLDYEGGVAGVGGIRNKGSGRVCGSGADVSSAEIAAQATRREETAEVMTWRGEVLHSHPFPTARDRRIWALHAEGIGTREISRQLHHRRRIVVASIADTTAAAKRRSQRRVDPAKAIRTAAPEFLAALWRCLA